MINDNFYMNLAIEEAWKYQGLTYPNPAVGGLILDKNKQIISISAHKKSGEAHSEVLVIKDAYFQVTKDEKILQIFKSSEIHKYLNENHKNIFKDFIIFTTLEPCNHYGKTPPCSLLIKNLGFKKVVIGVSDKNVEAKGGINFLNSFNIETTLLNSKESKDLLEPFLLWKKSRFVFFKYAQTINGNINDGIISSQESRIFVHQLRDKLNLMVIGGNSVRIDRPTLDSRLINGKASNILIFSRSQNFDRNIPLFAIKNRDVTISNSLENIKKNNFIMIEGGYSLLNKISEEINWLLLFVSPKIISTISAEIYRLNFEIVHQRKIGTDILIWLRKK